MLHVASNHVTSPDVLLKVDLLRIYICVYLTYATIICTDEEGQLTTM